MRELLTDNSLSAYSQGWNSALAGLTVYRLPCLVGILCGAPFLAGVKCALLFLPGFQGCEQKAEVSPSYFSNPVTMGLYEDWAALAWASTPSVVAFFCPSFTPMHSDYARLSHRICSVQFSCSVMPDSLWPHGLQHSRPPCPSPTHGACSNSCPSSQWWHPTISSSVIPFSSCLQSFPASGSFQMSQFFASGG